MAARRDVIAGLVSGAAWLAGGMVQARAQVPAPAGPASAAALVKGLDTLFAGPYPGGRAVHAKGTVARGSFVPHPDAAGLTRAVHLNGGTVPVVVRFSNFSGAPGAADAAAEASPRGMAVRFLLPGGEDTDIVAHSYNGFPAATPGAFMRFLQAAARPEQMPALAAESPAVAAFLADPKPAPLSFGTEEFFGVSAMRFTTAGGVSRFGRYRLVPADGVRHLSAVEAAARDPDYLRTELRGRLADHPVRFRLLVQVAAEGDAVADGSVPWPDSRALVELGTITLRELAAQQDEASQQLRFQATNLVAGIAPGPDPMLRARTEAYRISGDRRDGED